MKISQITTIPLIIGSLPSREPTLPEAQASYEKALALSPKYLKPYAQLARLAIGQGRFQDAADITDRAIKLGALDSCDAISIHSYNYSDKFPERGPEACSAWRTR